MNFFLIPGNPPAVHFYEEWAREIETRLPGSRARVSPYPQVSRDMNSAEAMNYIGLTHAAQLKCFQNEVSGKISLLGHSLGGHYALRLLRDDPSRIHRAFLIFPFLREPSREGKLILNLAGMVAGSGTLQSVALKSKKLIEKIVPEIRHVKDAELRNAAAIALHEKMTIGRDKSRLDLTENLRDKIVLFHTQKDWWCGQPFISSLSGVSVHECPEPHNFISVPAHRSGIFEKCEAFLKES